MSNKICNLFCAPLIATNVAVSGATWLAWTDDMVIICFSLVKKRTGERGETMWPRRPKSKGTGPLSFFPLCFGLHQTLDSACQEWTFLCWLDGNSAKRHRLVGRSGVNRSCPQLFFTPPPPPLFFFYSFFCTDLFNNKPVLMWLYLYSMSHVEANFICK